MGDVIPPVLCREADDVSFGRRIPQVDNYKTTTASPEKAANQEAQIQRAARSVCS